MTILCFSNPGEIDIIAAVTLGVNAKTGQSPVGQFGTGLKYAIAGVLRNSGRIYIYSGRTEYTFEGVPTPIRGQSFDLVHMNGHPVGFTTALGSHWEPWQMYRELVCNMADEGVGDLEVLRFDDWGAAEASGIITKGHTTILVECEALASLDHSQYFLGSQPLWANDLVEIHPRASSAVFYRGVHIASELDGYSQSKFTYNILAKQDLTEDRTFAKAHVAKATVARGILACPDDEIAKAIFVDADSIHFEYCLNYNHSDCPPSDAITKIILAQLAAKRGSLNSSVRVAVKNARPQEAEAAEESVPTEWPDIVAHAPEIPDERGSFSSPWDAMSYLEERANEAIKAATYWRKCAEALATPAEAP